MMNVKDGNVKEMTNDGSFHRQNNRFTTPFGDRPSELPVEPGRYRLIWCPACPWAHRAVIVRKLLGLEEAISLGTVSPMRPRTGKVDWEFSLDPEGVDPILRVRYLSDIYLGTDPDYAGRPTVPVMVEIGNKQAVNNDYHQLTTSFETAWAPYHKVGAPDLYPVDLRAEMEELNDSIFHRVNNGVYKCGFATSQESYEKAYDMLFDELDRLEELLSERRFLLGDAITDSDVRLYTTLVRFDTAYYNAFRCNRSLLREFHHLWGYVRDLYQTPGFGDTTDFDAIKRHYHLSITIDPNRAETLILPKGPDQSAWHTNHDRNRLSDREGKFR
ncbi:glutathione S-transferase family protein [Paenibacillus sp. strain BS8-2]